MTNGIGAILRDIVEMKARIIPLRGAAKLNTSYSAVRKHQHRCPLCRRMTMESDEVCGMPDDHVFACLPCLKVLSYPRGIRP